MTHYGRQKFTVTLFMLRVTKHATGANKLALLILLL